MTNPLKVLLFLAGGTAIAAVAAYLSGALDPILHPQPPAAVANVPGDGAASKPTGEPTLKEDRIETEEKPASTTPSASVPAEKPEAPSTSGEPQIASTGTQAQPAEPVERPEPAPAATPSFDVLRVEGDGSMVIAGKAASDATVELLNGDTIIGSGKASAGGDFVVILDNPLAPGDYQITIRTTNGDSSQAVSTQTAIVSVPAEPTGQVLAMIEEPGKPSEIITVPQPSAAIEPPKSDKSEEVEGASTADEPAPSSEPAAVEAPATATAPQASDEQDATETSEPNIEPKGADADVPADGEETPAPAPEVATTQAKQPETPPVDTTEPEAVATTEEPAATSADQPAQEDTPAQVAVADPTADEKLSVTEQASESTRPSQIVVEAVEIDGRNVFVAGRADPGSVVRAYANEIFLGEDLASEGGRFLVEAIRDLPVGSYIIRADVISRDGKRVMARAAVPFEREPGENIAAVADPAGEAAPALAQSDTQKVNEPELKAPDPEESKVAAAETPPAVPPATESAQATPPAGAQIPAVAAAEPEAPAQPVVNAQAPAVATAEAEAPARPIVNAEAPAVAATEPEASAPPIGNAEATAKPSASAEVPAPTEPPVAASTSNEGETPPTPEVASSPTDPSPKSEVPAPATTANETPPAVSTASEPPASVPESTLAPVSAEEKPAIASTESTPPKVEPQMPAAVAGNTGTSEITAPPLRNVKSAVIIRRGDTLWRISRRVYGRGVRYSTIYLANQDQIRDPDRIWPGQVFGVPNRTAQGEEADISKMGEQVTTQEE